MVVAEGIKDSAATMNTEDVNYRHFDRLTYRFSYKSEKQNESKYLCNKYKLPGRKHSGELVDSR